MTEFHYVLLNLHIFTVHLSKAAICFGNFVCPSVAHVDCIITVAYHETFST